MGENTLSGLISSLFGGGGGGGNSLANLAAASTGGYYTNNTGSTSAFPSLVSSDINAANNAALTQAANTPSLASLDGGQSSGGNAAAPNTPLPSAADTLQQYSTILQQQGGTGQPAQPQPPPVAAAAGPGPQGQGPQPWGANGGPMPGSVRQPPPGYQAVPPGTPADQGGPPAPPPQQPQASPGAGGGGVGPTPQMSAPQGIGAQGGLGGAGGMPLPALVQQLMQQMASRGQRPPWMRRPIERWGPYGPPRPGFSGQQGNFSGQQNRPYGVTARPGSGWPAPRYNYFQHAYPGQAPPSPQSMRTINTPAGRITANPMVAHDIDGFTRDLRAHGFPFEAQWGSYNRRRMRWGPEWSSHAWGSAFDINDRDGPLSPRVANWIRNNQQLWQQIKRRWNMGQPLAGADGIGGKDPAHVEWMGPGQGGAPQQQGQPPVAQPAAPPAPPVAAATGPPPQAYPWGQGPGYSEPPDTSAPPAQPWTGADTQAGDQSMVG